MRNWQFEFSGQWPAGIIILLALAGALTVWACYRRKRAALAPWRYYTLMGLRMLALVAVALFLLKPVIRFSHTRVERRQLIVLVDASQSMGIRDSFEGKSRLETARLLLRDPQHDLLRKLGKDYQVHLFTFGETVSETPADAEIEADAKATAIGDALRNSVVRVGADALTAVVILSDGVSTAGEDVRKVARSLGVPVVPVVLGGRMEEKGRFMDIGIAGAPHNPELIVNNTAKLKLRISNSGLEALSEADRQVALTLKKGDQVVGSLPVQFPSSAGSRDVEVEYVPREVGLYMLRAELPVMPGETVRENNSRDFMVNVIDPKIRTLIVEGVARSEYRFLYHVLSSDPSVEVTSVVKLRKDVFLQQGAAGGIDLSKGLPARAEDFAKFNVVILGDIARDEFSDEQLSLLKKFVSDGGALLALGGYHAFGPGGYAGSPLDELLPVRIGGAADGQCETAFAPVLTAAGAAHPIFQGCAEFFRPGANEVKLDGVSRTLGCRPGASLLLQHPSERAGNEPLPIVAEQRYGQGRVLAVTADTTWKWKFQHEGRGLGSPYYRFWRQSLRWLAAREDAPRGGAGLAAWTAKVEYEPGEPALIEAQLHDDSGQPKERADIALRIEGAAAGPTPVELRLEEVPLSPGRYQVSFRPQAPGVYHAVVTASEKQRPLGEARFDFMVGRVAGEFDSVDADEPAMKALARETGGRCHNFADAARIPEELIQRSRQVVYREEKNLWNGPEFFLVFLGCITAEWVLRRRSGLN